MLESIKLLVFDFDGVLTDNRVLVHQDGTESVWCHRGDGWGIKRLRDLGLDMMILSTEKNPVVKARGDKLQLPVIQGCDDKLKALKEVVAQKGLDAAEVAFVGNDTNDQQCLEWVGVPIVVADAEPAVLPLAKLTTTRRGGYGAVREIASWILQEQKPHDTLD